MEIETVHHIPYEGHALMVGDAVLEDARQLRIDDLYWVRTRGNNWEPTDEPETNVRTVVISPASILGVDGNAFFDEDRRPLYTERLHDFFADVNKPTPLTSAQERESALAEMLRTVPDHKRAGAELTLEDAAEFKLAQQRALNPGQFYEDDGAGEAEE